MCLFLSMVVWQPFHSYWRLIIARVSEMHVAYQMLLIFWVISSSEHHNSKTEKHVLTFPSSSLTCIVM